MALYRFHLDAPDADGQRPIVRAQHFELRALHVQAKQVDMPAERGSIVGRGESREGVGGVEREHMRMRGLGMLIRVGKGASDAFQTAA